MKKVLVSALAALAIVVGGVAPAANATSGDLVPTQIDINKTRIYYGVGCAVFDSTASRSNFVATVNGQTVTIASLGFGMNNSVELASDIPPLATVTLTYTQDPNNLIDCSPSVQVGSFSLSGTAPALPAQISGVTVSSSQSGSITASWTAVGGAGGYIAYYSTSPTGPWLGNFSTNQTSKTWTSLTPTDALYFSVATMGQGGWNSSPFITSSAYLPNGAGNNPVYTPSQSSSSSSVAPVVPVFKQPKFAMPSKIDVDATGKVSLSGKDMGVSTVLIGGKEQKIDTNSDEKLVFDTTGLAKGVHDLVMKGAFGTYTVQKAIQVGEAVVTKVAAVSARQVGMAGGELSISGQGLEGTTQITMNGQVLEIVSKTDSKVTFKVPASTVASVNSIMIEGSFVPVIFKNAFSYTK